MVVGLVQELLADGREQQDAGRKEKVGAWTWLVCMLVKELLLGGWEEQAAGPQKGGWTRGYHKLLVLFGKCSVIMICSVI